MTLLESLLDAIIRLDGEALIMHVGEKPYVVLSSTTLSTFRGPLSWGQVELSSRPLTLDAVMSMLGQMLSPEQRHMLDELGAIEHEIDAPADVDERFVVTAARGGDDVWVEVKRKPKRVEGPALPEPAVVTAGVAIATAQAADTNAIAASMPAPASARFGASDGSQEPVTYGSHLSVADVESAVAVRTAALEAASDAALSEKTRALAEAADAALAGKMAALAVEADTVLAAREAALASAAEASLAEKFSALAAEADRVLGSKRAELEAAAGAALAEKEAALASAAEASAAERASAAAAALSAREAELAAAAAASLEEKTAALAVEAERVLGVETCGARNRRGLCAGGERSRARVGSRSVGGREGVSGRVGG